MEDRSVAMEAILHNLSFTEICVNSGSVTKTIHRGILRDCAPGREEL